MDDLAKKMTAKQACENPVSIPVLMLQNSERREEIKDCVKRLGEFDAKLERVIDAVAEIGSRLDAAANVVRSIRKRVGKLEGVRDGEA